MAKKKRSRSNSKPFRVPLRDEVSSGSTSYKDRESELPFKYEKVKYKVFLPQHYMVCIRQLREILDKRSASNLNIIDIMMQTDTNPLHIVEIKMMKSNLYIKGFYNGYIWELGDEHFLSKRSRLLKIGESYSDFAPDGVENIKLGFFALNKAAKTLRIGDDYINNIGLWKSSIATIVVSLAEGARFHHISDRINKGMTDVLKREFKIPDLESYVKNWKGVSKIAALYDPRIKQNETEEKEECDIKKAYDVKKIISSKHKKLAFECIAIPCLLKKSPDDSSKP